MKKEKILTTVEFMGCTFTLGNAKAFDKDFESARAILERNPETWTKAERFKLLSIYRPSYHESGKIEGITSYDSSATNCRFCMAMRAEASRDAAHICNLCYDHAQEHSYKGLNVINRHTLNMLIMMATEYTPEELSIIDCSKINRVNSSGDTPNKTYAVNMLRLAAINKHAFFALFAKNTAAVKAACRQEGKPENMTLVQSSRRINHPDPIEEFFDIVFTVYVNKAETEKAIAAGAGACNGKKCRECGFKCYLNGWAAGQNVAEVLRCNKEERERIERALGLRK